MCRIALLLHYTRALAKFNAASVENGSVGEIENDDSHVAMVTIVLIGLSNQNQERAHMIVLTTKNNGHCMGVFSLEHNF